MKTDSNLTVPCKTCSGGMMHRKKKYVLGAGGAILRFFLMAPGVLMVLIGLFGVLGSGGSMSEASERKQEMTEKLRVIYQEKGLAPAMIDATLQTGRYQGDRSSMSMGEEYLLSQLESAYLSIQADELMKDGTAVLAGGISMVLLFVGLVFMAFGFIIGIRKWKLICNKCGSAIKAA